MVHAWGGFGRRSNWSVWLITFFTTACLGPGLLASSRQPYKLGVFLPINHTTAHNASETMNSTAVYTVQRRVGREGLYVEVFKGAAGEEERRMGGGGSSLHHTDALLPIKPGCTELLLLQLINHGCSKELQAASFSRKGAGIILVNCKP